MLKHLDAGRRTGLAGREPTVYVQSIRPVLPARSGFLGWGGGTCWDRPEQVKVLAGTNTHPLGKTETMGLPVAGSVMDRSSDQRCSTWP